ncbi:hypothetical protein TIFTF001_015350 [Ficus carica]|uniref:DDE Tnp4 domain-containing protein n=1 Tax=Ficus carica TaxID=3494 RepID=A0AA88D6G5_FICCA|nr:hypothetical protein TIFTF001_015350 [Ficus carica]
MNGHGSAPHHEDDDHGSRNAQRDVHAMLTRAVVAATIGRRNRRRDPVPMHNSSLPGSCHDARILVEAIAFYGFPIPPPGKFYLADSGYANKDCFLSPYRRETYHLPEYRRQRGGLGNCRGMHSYPMDKQKMILVACAIVHNFIRMVQIGDPLLEEYVAECMPVTENDDVNADYVFDDIFDGTGSSTGSQQHDSRRDAMNQLKDMMADKMWDRYQSAPWYKTT